MFASLRLLVATLGVCAALGAGPLPAAEWRPQQFHAAGDGVTLDTVAIQAAIDAAHSAGGGTVRLTAGRYLAGTLELRSGVTLSLDKDATLLGSSRLADYRRGKWPALLLAVDQENIALTGAGVVDGRGALVAADSVRIFESGNLVEFFPGIEPGQTVNLGADTTAGRVIDPHALHRAGELAALVAPRSRADMATWRVDECVRPQLIEFTRCRGVSVSGVGLRNAASWVQAYRYCEDLEITGVRVDSTTYWNNDGLDVVNCRRVRIADCDINAADDGICLKSEPNDENRGCEDVVIERCRVRTSASAIKLGTASHHAFRRISIRNIEVRDTYRSAVALETVDGAVLEDIEVAGVRARNTGNALFLRVGQRNPSRPPGMLRNVVLRDFEVEIPSGRPDEGYPHAGPPLKVAANLIPASIVGLPDRPVENVVLRNIHLTYGGGARRDHAEVSLDRLADVPEKRADYPEFSMFGELPAWGFYLRHVRGVRFEQVTLRLQSPDFRSAIVADRVTGLALSDISIGPGGGEPVIVLAGADDAALTQIEMPPATAEGIRRLSVSATR